MSKVAAVVAVLLAAVTLAPLAQPVTASAAPAAIFTTPRDLVVDPGTGRVFLAGDDAVAVLAPDGTLLKKIPDIWGASGLDATQGAIWVNESTAGTIAKIDPVSMTVTTTYVVGAAVGDSLTIVGNVAWLGNHSQWGGIGRFDLTTSAYTTTGSFYGPAAKRRGTSTTDVIIYERGISSGGMHRISTTAPYAELASGGAGGYFGDLAINATGTRIWTATGAPYAFGEYDAVTLKNTGTTYPAEPYPRAVAWTGAHGGQLAGITHGYLDVYSAGASAAVAKIPVPITSYTRGFDLSPDGNTAYAVDDAGVLQVVDIRPTAASLSPSTVVRDVPTAVTVTGTALGGTDEVTVGGISVDPGQVTTTSVTFTMPRNASVGTQSVQLHGPTGTATTSISVTANTGAVLKGTVRANTTTVAGATLTLSGGALTSPVQVTAASNGTYAFGPVGYGTTYALTVHDPTGAAPDQTVKGITLVPNDPTTLDVDLSRPNGTGSEVARTPLAMTSAADLLVDPASGKIAVAGGDEVAILNADGLLTARFRGLYGARSLTLVGSSLYVGTAQTARVVRIDLATSAITGSWDLGVETNGSIAAAGGKIWFVSGDDQWTGIGALDPATGATTFTKGSFYVPLLRSVAGAPNRFTATEQGISSAPTTLFDGSGSTATAVASTDLFDADVTPSAPLTAVSATGRVYGANGYQFRLSDLQADGVRYPATGPTAYSPGKGGLVAFGSTIARAGTPAATHKFGTTPSATGLNADGTRLFTVEGSAFVVRDLAPTITGVAAPVGSSTVTLTGTGLATATGVAVDGSPVTFHDTTATSVQIDLPALSAGVHTVTVTTPWGTSDPAPLDRPAATLPGAQRTPSATAVAGGVKVSWTAPSSDGGSPITGYKATIQPGGASCTTAGALTCTVTGLSPGSEATASVVAVNAVGEGPSSTAESVMVPTPPDAPGSVATTAGPSRVIVEWTAPVDDGGLPVTGYELCTSTDPTVPVATSSCVRTTSTATQRAVTGLVPGTAYYARVRAENAIGAGAWSAASTGATPFTVPGAPTSVIAVAGDHKATVSWTPPTSDGGSTITRYSVIPYRDGEPQAAIQLTPYDAGPVEVTGLRRGSEYSFAVTAANAAGTGPLSTASAPIVPTRPGPAYAPFASWDAFVSEQLVDFTGKRGTTASRATVVAALSAGTMTPEDYVASLMSGDEFWPYVPPTVRLYWAYFDRIPDYRGLQHWVAARRSGTTLIRISASFAGSSEFKRTYGSLSNAQFVDLVYENVLGRPGDASGRKYWITKLDRGMSRGQVMVSFSESGEYLRTTKGRVGVVAVFTSMLKRSPTASELAEWQGEDVQDLIMDVLDSEAYAYRHP